MTENFSKALTVPVKKEEKQEEKDKKTKLEGYINILNQDFVRHRPAILFENYIGRGSYGYVFSGKFDYEGQKEAAIKIMKPHLLKTKDPMDLKDIKKRFMNECVIQYDLSQKLDKIVKVYDYGEFGNYRFMITELMSNKNLRYVINDYRNYLLKDRVSIMIDIAEILSEIHKRGIIHRDLKPENSLFSKKTYIIEEGEEKRFEGERIIKLSDLGIIRWIQAHSPTEKTDIIGTPDYMSPEQVNDPHIVDHRTDIFSFGVVFYELLNGEYPRKTEKNTEDRLEYVSRLVNIPARDFVNINPNINGLNDIVMKCIAKDPSDRYQYMDEVVIDLKDYYNRKFAA